MAVIERNLVFKLARRLKGYATALVCTIRFTKTWPAALMAYLLKRPMQITFRNGLRGSYGWSDIRRIHGILEDKMSLSRLPAGIFEVNFDGIRIRAPLRNMDCIGYVFIDPFYDLGVDYRGKVILDVGAYIGDTALYFWRRGAAKVICYEPVAEFFAWLKQNITLNGINVEAFNFGISDRGGEVGVPFPTLDVLDGFVGHSGNQSIKIKTLTLNEVLSKHQPIDIIKLVCPNFEEGVFNNISDIELASVPTWIIASYDRKLAIKLEDKFVKAGFGLKALNGILGWYLVIFEQMWVSHHSQHLKRL